MGQGGAGRMEESVQRDGNAGRMEGKGWMERRGEAERRSGNCEATGRSAHRPECVRNALDSKALCITAEQREPMLPPIRARDLQALQLPPILVPHLNPLRAKLVTTSLALNVSAGIWPSGSGPLQ